MNLTLNRVLFLIPSWLYRSKGRRLISDYLTLHFYLTYRTPTCNVCVACVKRACNVPKERCRLFTHGGVLIRHPSDAAIFFADGLQFSVRMLPLSGRE